MHIRKPTCTRFKLINFIPRELAEAAALQALADGIKRIRARSNELEADPPSDYADDSHWSP